MSEVAILSDIHMRTGHEIAVEEALESTTERLAAAHEVEHVFVLGDLIEDTDDPDLDVRRIERVASILDAGPAPVTYLLGNHDIGTLSRDTLSTALSQDRFYGTVTIEGTPFVSLDSTVDGGGARGALGLEQLSWVDEHLPENAILLVHHPIGNFPLAENYWFRRFPERAYLWNRKELLIRTRDRLRATISGHIHQPGHTAFEDVLHASADAISKKAPETPTKGRYLTLSLDEKSRLTWYVDGEETASCPLR